MTQKPTGALEARYAVGLYVLDREYWKHNRNNDDGAGSGPVLFGRRLSD